MENSELLKKRLSELSYRAFERGYTTFSEFLNIDEISTLKSLKLPCSAVLFGGYEGAERCVAGFGESIDNYDFPICCLKIEPVQQKFADKLNHRDFLGSLMNLGINRNTLGDIIVINNIGYLFCLESISEYITQNLKKVKHTTINCEALTDSIDFLIPEPEEKEIIVSSLRADAVISSVFKLSRNEAASLFAGERIFINSKAVLKDSVLLKDNDIVSVRGKGKFIFSQKLRETKKGRIIVTVKVYK